MSHSNWVTRREVNQGRITKAWLGYREAHKAWCRAPRLARVGTPHHPKPKGPRERECYWNKQRIAVWTGLLDRMYSLEKRCRHCTAMFIEALFTTAERWKQLKCPPTDEWINKMWYIQTMDYYSALKRKEFLTCATTQMKLGVEQWLPGAGKSRE